ncbi:MAG: type II toxin-antitoxin system HicB family antitoxin [Bryobacteraceae bacterium]
MEYPARFVKDKASGGFVVTFPDVPEAITEGETLNEAMAMAQEALELALTFYVEASRDLPKPGTLKKGMRLVPVPALSEAKFMLYEALRSAGVRKWSWRGGSDAPQARLTGCWTSNTGQSWIVCRRRLRPSVSDCPFRYTTRPRDRFTGHTGDSVRLSGPDCVRIAVECLNWSPFYLAVLSP